MRCGIIGYGRFGKLWAKCLAEIGQEVFVYDRKRNNKKIRGIKFVSLEKVLSVNFLFLLVPISEIENVCKEVANKIDKNTMVIDAGSVKMFPVRIMKKYLLLKQPLMATHPLFGPDSVLRFGLAGQKIVLCPLRTNKVQLKKFESLLKKMKLKIIKTTPERHDEEMAKSQALVHFIGRGLEGLNLKDQLIATPDYQALLRMNAMVQNDTWQLFFDMQKLNPYSEKLRLNFLESINFLQTELETDRKKTLPELRNKISFIDEKIILLLSKRFELVKEIGNLKKLAGLSIENKGQEKKIFSHYKKLAFKNKLNNNLIKQIFSFIITESKRLQKK